MTESLTVVPSEILTCVGMSVLSWKSSGYTHACVWVCECDLHSILQELKKKPHNWDTINKSHRQMKRGTEKVEADKVAGEICYGSDSHGEISVCAVFHLFYYV